MHPAHRAYRFLRHNASDVSASEETGAVRAAATSQPFSEGTELVLSLDLIEQLCPSIKYLASVAEFQEQICTICLGEY